MNGMDGHDHHNHMPGMGMAPPPGMTPHRRHSMMMHMTFYWGHEALILFRGWPGRSASMYAVALVFVFFLSFILEGLSDSRLVKPGSRSFGAGLAQTLIYAVRVGLAYMVMLAVMSFNVGVFLAAVAGHALGFMVFGSRAFKSSDAKGSEVVHSHC